MSEEPNIQASSGVPMVRIDGTVVRKLREERGFTQLYVATAVGVTTDTISRWENKKYPTIKRENGLRLAEVLGVEPETVFVPDDEEKPAPRPAQEPRQTRLGIPLDIYHRIINIALAIMIPLVIGLMIWKKPVTRGSGSVEAVRVLPRACAPGLAFPVVIRVSDAEQVPLLVRESVPAHAELVATVPPLTSREDRTMKWLRRDDGTSRDVGYILRAGTGADILAFSGSITVGSGKGRQVVIGGPSSMRVAPVHWADSNGDSRISDDEILEMYDRFGGLPGLAEPLERAEEIWMGSGYRWNEAEQSLEVIP
jgi:transcriptional regulator with XRE-family HTH domain